MDHNPHPVGPRGQVRTGVDSARPRRAWKVDSARHEAQRHEPPTHTKGPDAPHPSAGGRARGARRGPVHRHARHLDRERGAPPDPGRGGPVGRRHHVGGQRLRPGVRSAAPGRRADGRPARAPPGTHRRPHAVRGVVAGRRSGRLPRRPDHRPRRSGPRHRRHRPGRARSDDGPVPVRPRAWPGPGGVGRGLRCGRGGRRPAGRCAHPGLGLALDLLRRRTRVGAGPGRRRGPRATGGARPDGRTVRPAGHHHRHTRPDLPGLGADHRTRRRLDGRPAGCSAPSSAPPRCSRPSS